MEVESREIDKAQETQYRPFDVLRTRSIIAFAEEYEIATSATQNGGLAMTEEKTQETQYRPSTCSGLAVSFRLQYRLGLALTRKSELTGKIKRV